MSLMEKIRRRPLSEIPAEERAQPLEFMVTAISTPDRNKSELFLFGPTRLGDSVCARVQNFYHYFWMEKPTAVHANDLDELKALWNSELARHPSAKDCIVALSVHRRENAFYYKGKGDQKRDFIRVDVSSPSAFYDARKYFRAGSIPLPRGQRVNEVVLFEEESVDYAARFMCDLAMVGFGWVRLSQDSFVADSSVPSSCTYNVLVQDPTQIEVLQECADVAPLRTLDFDIECLSIAGFPTSDTCPVIQIAMQLWQTAGSGGSEDRLLADVVLCTGGDIEPLDDSHELKGVVEFMTFDSEADMLRAFSNIALAADYDVSRSFNGRGFDWAFLFDRAAVLGVEKHFASFSRLRSVPATIETSSFTSSARGSRDFRDAAVPGRVDFDILHVVRCEEKLAYYSLDAVCTEFLGSTKENVHHSQISVLYNGSAHDRQRLALYCRKDALLCRLLDTKRMYLTRYIEQARVCRVTLEALILRGQQVKVIAQLLHLAREFDFVLPLKRIETGYEIEGKYDGALVLDPVQGFHREPIAVLDFSSLYPSIIMSRNLCYSTLVRPTDAVRMPAEDVYRSPAGHYFVRHHVREGILVLLERRLIAARKQAKNDCARIKAEADSLEAAGDAAGAKRKRYEASVQDARQIALKLSANSAYGFTGVSRQAGGKLSCFEVSESITAIGRESLMRVVNYLAERFPQSTMCYGDSVTGDTPVMLRINGGHTRIVRCDEVPNITEWVSAPGGKQEARFGSSSIEIWSDGGWQRVRRFIRHACHKPIMRILTHTGMVDCTTDHSLVLANGSEISPEDVRIGTELLHYPFPVWPIKPSPITPNEAFCMGLFMADGSCGKYETKWGVKYSWAINNADRALLEDVHEKLPFQNKILDTMASSSVYKIVPFGSIKPIVTKYRAMFYNEAREKKVPDEILYADMEIIRAFTDGFYAGDGSRKEKIKEPTKHRFSHNGKQAAMGLMVLYERLGYNVSLNTRWDKTNTFRLQMIFNAFCREEYATKKIETLHEAGTYTGHVYDFETENSHFSVGPGHLVVHNTDSVMVKPGCATVKEAMEWMHATAADINRDLFGDMPPMKLAPEKVMMPTLFQAKKRYLAGYYESTHERPDKMYSRGTEDVRRDGSILSRSCLSECYRRVFIEQDIEGALQHARNTIEKLYLNEVELQELIMTRALSKPVEQYTNAQPQSELARKMARRDPSSAPAVGDRVAFVMVGSGTKNVAAMAEDPLYVMEHRVPINVEYYIENQLREPLQRLFAPIVGDRRTAELFTGEHTRRRVRPSQAAAQQRAPRGSIMAFATLRRTCANVECQALYDPKKHRHPTLCPACVETHGEAVHAEKRRRLEDQRTKYETQLDICRACQGSERDPVLCMSRTCPQLYRRKEAEFKLASASKDIEDICGLSSSTSNRK